MSQEILKLDLYHILGVDETASEREIVKGYRSAALNCHPDKNPDNPKAAELFHQVSEALKILTDAAAKAAYDRSRKAKKESEARNKALDSKRKKLKEDLEAREQAAEERLKTQRTTAAEKNLQKEIERLRREGSRLLEQEQERLRQELRSNKPSSPKPEPEEEGDRQIPRIKLKWKAAKGDPSNGGYSELMLTEILSPYGRINSLLVSTKRNGSAIVEFESTPGVSPKILEETGLAESPFAMVWLSGKPSTEGALRDEGPRNGGHLPFSGCAEPTCANPTNVRTTFSPQAFPLSGSSSTPHATVAGGVGSSASQGLDLGAMGVAGKDFESVVLMKMRQAEERKRLIAQMEKDDAENG